MVLCYSTANTTVETEYILYMCLLRINLIVEENKNDNFGFSVLWLILNVTCTYSVYILYIQYDQRVVNSKQDGTNLYMYIYTVYICMYIPCIVSLIRVGLQGLKRRYFTTSAMSFKIIIYKFKEYQ